MAKSQYVLALLALSCLTLTACQPATDDPADGADSKAGTAMRGTVNTPTEMNMVTTPITGTTTIHRLRRQTK